MPIDDPTPGDRQPYQGGPPGRAAYEGEGPSDRPESSSWERFESSPQGGAGDFSIDEAEANPIISFLDHQLRERPIPTLLAALAAGWLVGKLLR